MVKVKVVELEFNDIIQFNSFNHPMVKVKAQSQQAAVTQTPVSTTLWWKLKDKKYKPTDLQFLFQPPYGES